MGKNKPHQSAEAMRYGPTAGNDASATPARPAVPSAPASPAPLDDKQQALAEWERDLKQQAALSIENRRQADARAAQLAQQAEQLQQQAEQLQQQAATHAAHAATLQARDEQLLQAEAERDQGFLRQRAQQRDTLAAEHQRQLTAIERQLALARNERTAVLEQELAQQRQQFAARCACERQALAQREQELDERQHQLQRQQQEAQTARILLDVERADLAAREAGLPVRVERLARDRIESAEAELASARSETQHLLAVIASHTQEAGRYELLKRQLGGQDPSSVSQMISELRQSNEQLVRELDLRPGEQLRHDFERSREQQDALTRQNSELEGEIRSMQPAQQKLAHAEREASALSNDKRHLQDQLEALENQYLELSDKYKRVSASTARPEEREARIKDLRIPLREFAAVLPRSLEKSIDEVTWLDNISQQCKAHGLRFERRVLNAFHTALKTAEFSPLTVLAGASGTGKSELPRLYAHFGGINFLNVPVQPNWDSQESMLGFFNAIDNRFDAQPLLRLLVQAQEAHTDDYHGLHDTMNLVLLDEMNLAHVEMYFAEFLSRLENRRSVTRDRVPALEVKLGAGIAPYELKLDRNVLWAGTMNQDETTKTLSDKVIDRGFILHFPRPKEFHRREELKPLENSMVPRLTRRLWGNWVRHKSTFTDAQLTPFKRTAQQINEALGTVGRALGHRVWQSIEYYMANHPDVIAAGDTDALPAAMHLAFEDQLVLKIMPKLRGIETRGGQCLPTIRAVLSAGGYLILDDFDRACEIGYGQFHWSSADYLTVGDAS